MTDSQEALREHKRISAGSLDQLFRQARTHWVWRPEPVPMELLKEVYELARLGPTSANSSPARFVFITTPEAKERLRPALSPGNVEKTMTAPVTVIVAWDTEFYEKLARLFPARDMRSIFAGICSSPFRISAPRVDAKCRMRPINTASSVMIVVCDVNVFVAATPISGPACM